MGKASESYLTSNGFPLLENNTRSNGVGILTQQALKSELKMSRLEGRGHKIHTL